MAQGKKICWVVTDGRAGAANQALGLAEAVSRRTPLSIVIKTIAVRAPWRSLPRAVWGDPFTKLERSQSLLRPPHPDLWIACGRASAAFTSAVKKSRTRTFTVQLQNPGMALSDFDLVIPPSHDGLSGDNVFETLGAPNRITSEAVKADGAALAPIVSHLPSPRAAFLVGGHNRNNKVDEAQAEGLLMAISSLLGDGVGVMVTTSRRTPLMISERLTEMARAHDSLFFWDGAAPSHAPNPYFGMLSLADHVIVTDDSVNMAADAASAGKAAQIYYWRGADHSGGARKFREFHAALEARGFTKPFDGALTNWSIEPFDETGRAADEVVRRMHLFDVMTLSPAYAAK